MRSDEEKKEYAKAYRKAHKKEMAEYHKEWRKKNEKREQKKQKKYYKENRDRCLKASKDWREKNKDKVKAYRVEHKQEISDYHKKWYKKNEKRQQKYNRKLYEKNKDKILAYHKVYQKEYLKRPEVMKKHKEYQKEYYVKVTKPKRNLERRLKKAKKMIKELKAKDKDLVKGILLSPKPKIDSDCFLVEKRYETHFEEIIKNGWCYKSVDDNDIMQGFIIAGCDGITVNVHDIEVKENCSNKGIGSELLEKILQKASKSKIPVELSADWFNYIAFSFYRKHYPSDMRPKIVVKWDW